MRKSLKKKVLAGLAGAAAPGDHLDYRVLFENPQDLLPNLKEFLPNPKDFV